MQKKELRHSRISKSLIALLLLSSSVLFGENAEKPLMRVGMLTDTHIKKDIKSCANLKWAFELFKEKEVVLVTHSGDIGDKFDPQAYKNYMQTWNEVFQDSANQPKRLFVYGNHDRYGHKGNAYEEVQKLLNSNNIYEDLKLNGYHFIAFPESEPFKNKNGKWSAKFNTKRYKEMLDKAIADTPDKPVFVFDHVPAENTTNDSIMWGSNIRRKILDKYPSVVHISGHVHGTPVNELQIWQGNFTAVNAGTLYYWGAGSNLIGFPEKWVNASNALILEIYPKKLIVRRYFLPSKKEYLANTPWTIPLPFNPKTAPYNPERRAANFPKPEFPAKSTLQLKTDTPFKTLTITHPAAEHPNRTFRYQYELGRKKASGEWEKFALEELFGEVDQTEKEPPYGKRSHKFSSGYFDAGKEYRVFVTPINYFGGKGTTLTADFKAPEKPSTKTVFETANPMKDCQFVLQNAKKTPVPQKDGCFEHNRGTANLLFPENIWEGAAKTSFRVTVELDMDQATIYRWKIHIRNTQKLNETVTRAFTVGSGKTGLKRIVLEFAKKRDTDTYCLSISRGGKEKYVLNQ